MVNMMKVFILGLAYLGIASLLMWYLPQLMMFQQYITFGLSQLTHQLISLAIVLIASFILVRN